MSIVPFSRHRRGFSGPFGLWDPFQGFPLDTSLAAAAAAPSSFFEPFGLHLWDPFDSYPFGTAITEPSSGIEWKETPEAHFFKASLPGVKEEEVQVEAVGQALQISAAGKFLCRFSLPENAKMDHLWAGMEGGVLVVMVPKGEVRRADVQIVEISG